MADTFKLEGKFSIKPPVTAVDLSGDFEIAASLLEQLAVTKKHADLVKLETDPAEAFSMADVSNAHLLIIKSTAAVTVRVTTAAGATQAFYVNKLLILTCEDKPITAITLQREAGAYTECRVVVAEK